MGRRLRRSLGHVGARSLQCPTKLVILCLAEYVRKGGTVSGVESVTGRSLSHSEVTKVGIPSPRGLLCLAHIEDTVTDPIAIFFCIQLALLPDVRLSWSLEVLER
jgi:hypothetical protein